MTEKSLRLSSSRNELEQIAAMKITLKTCTSSRRKVNPTLLNPWTVHSTPRMYAVYNSPETYPGAFIEGLKPKP